MAEKKARVYQVAKDFSISSEALLEILRGLGASAKSHMSTVDPAVIEKVRERFQEEKQAVKDDDARKQEAKAAKEREAAEAKAKAEAEAKAKAEAEAAARAAAQRPAPPAPPEGEAPSAPAPGAAAARTSLRGPRPRTERRRRRVVDEQTVRDNVKRTLANLESGGKAKRYKKKMTDLPATPPAAEGTGGVATQAPEGPVIRVNELASVAELADKLEINATQIISKLLGMGKMVTQNQRLDKDTIELVAMEFDHSVEFEEEVGADRIEEEVDAPEDLKPRPPVVTVMGHVDHGKTSLLDTVRKTNVVAGEKGGITQHIGAYEVRLKDGRQVCFLDTPGHQAFTAMRARGAQVTDIVVLVVAADDRVMPQTVEAMDHAKAAGVPLIVALNKVDKPEANLPMIKQDLANHNLLIEEYGGQVPAVEISAKKGTGIDELLEIILLQADLLELTANPDRRAKGVVIESKVEQGRGIVATVLVQTGTLKIGDPFVCGSEYGKVRSMADERGKRVKAAGPSTPVEVTGWSGNPAAGDVFQVAVSESVAREVGAERGLVERERSHRRRQQVRLTDFHQQMEQGRVEELRLIIKADVAGSVEVLAEQLGGIEHAEVRTEVIHSGVGQINESDVLLASASNAVIIGFNVKSDPGAQSAAGREGVDIKHYSIIYEAVADVKSALEGMLKPEEVEKIMATIEVRQVFRISKAGTIAGCYVQSGTVNRNQRARLLRDGEEIWKGGLGSLKRFKDDVREVASGFECGIGLDGFDALQEGDIIETYVIEEIARRLS